MLAALSGRASAQDAVDACAKAAVNGQELRREGRLREARARFASCASNACRGDIVRDCTAWVAEVDAATPSIVVGARDAAGTDLVDVRVLVDDRPLDARERDRALALDPGPHSVRFERRGADPITKKVMLREGEKLREVTVVFPIDRVATPQPAAAPGAPPDQRGSSIPPLVYVTGAVSLIGLATFGVAGGLGAADWRRSDCGDGCVPDDASRVRTQLLIADVALVVGLVAGALATTFYLTRPTR